MYSSTQGMCHVVFYSGYTVTNFNETRLLGEFNDALESRATKAETEEKVVGEAAQSNLKPPIIEPTTLETAGTDCAVPNFNDMGINISDGTVQSDLEALITDTPVLVTAWSNSPPSTDLHDVQDATAPRTKVAPETPIPVSPAADVPDTFSLDGAKKLWNTKEAFDQHGFIVKGGLALTFKGGISIPALLTKICSSMDRINNIMAAVIKNSDSDSHNVRAHRHRCMQIILHQETNRGFYWGKNQRLPDLGKNLGKNQGVLLPSKNHAGKSCW